MFLTFHRTTLLQEIPPPLHQLVIFFSREEKRALGQKCCGWGLVGVDTDDEVEKEGEEGQSSNEEEVDQVAVVRNKSQVSTFGDEPAAARSQQGQQRLQLQHLRRQPRWRRSPLPWAS
jgi:hypothetical protein